MYVIFIRNIKVSIKSLRGFAIDLDDAFTARGGMESCTGALFGFMLSSTSFTMCWFVQSKLNVFIDPL